MFRYIEISDNFEREKLVQSVVIHTSSVHEHGHIVFGVKFWLMISLRKYKLYIIQKYSIGKFIEYANDSIVLNGMQLIFG
jgi:hypothetical protein